MNWLLILLISIANAQITEQPVDKKGNIVEQKMAAPQVKTLPKAPTENVKQTSESTEEILDESLLFRVQFLQNISDPCSDLIGSTRTCFSLHLKEAQVTSHILAFSDLVSECSSVVVVEIAVESRCIIV